MSPYVGLAINPMTGSPYVGLAVTTLCRVYAYRSTLGSIRYAGHVGIAALSCDATRRYRDLRTGLGAAGRVKVPKMHMAGTDGGRRSADEIDSTRRSQSKIAAVRGGRISGAGGCQITAVRNVRTRPRTGG